MAVRLRVSICVRVVCLYVLSEWRHQRLGLTSNMGQNKRAKY